MTCLHCAKKIPLIRRWSDQQFCCDEHRRAHLQEATHTGLARLLENPVPAKFAELPVPPSSIGTADGLAHSMGELRFGNRLHTPVAGPQPAPPPVAHDPETPRLAAVRYYLPPLELAANQHMAARECGVAGFRRQGPVWTFLPRRGYRLAPPCWRRPDTIVPADDANCQATWWPDLPHWHALPLSLGTAPRPYTLLPRGAGPQAAPAVPAASGRSTPLAAGEFGFASWPRALPGLCEDALELREIGATWEPRSPAPALADPPGAPTGSMRWRQGAGNPIGRAAPHPASSVGKVPAPPPAPDFPVAAQAAASFPAAECGPPLLALEPRLPALAWTWPARRLPFLAVNEAWPPAQQAVSSPFPEPANPPARAAVGPVIARFTLTGVRLPAVAGEPDLFLAKPGIIPSQPRAVSGAALPFAAAGGWLGSPVALPEPVAVQREPLTPPKPRQETPSQTGEPVGLQPFLAPAAAGPMAAADIPAAPVSSFSPASAPSEPAAEPAAAARSGFREQIRRLGDRAASLVRQGNRQRRRISAAIRRTTSLGGGIASGFTVPDAVQRLWRATPAYARGIMLVVPLMVPTLFYARLQTAAPPAATFTSLREAIRARATILIEEEFRTGFGAWSGPPAWQLTWALDQAGAALPGSLAILEKSRTLGDYRVEFAAQIEKRGLAFALRSADTQNYHAVQFVLAKPGPLPVVHIIRYPVVNGRAGQRTELPMPLALRPDTLYQVTAHVRGDQFVVSVNGQVVDTWTDPLHPTGGVGFFTEKGMTFRLRRVRVVDKDDFLGWLCSQFSPRTADSISSR